MGMVENEECILAANYAAGNGVGGYMVGPWRRMGRPDDQGLAMISGTGTRAFPAAVTSWLAARPLMVLGNGVSDPTASAAWALLVNGNAADILAIRTLLGGL